MANTHQNSLDTREEESQNGAAPTQISHTQWGEVFDRLSAVEAYIGRQAADSKTDALRVRVEELERKHGEGAPDLLLNEIASRLSAVESDKGGEASGGRLEEFAEEISELKGKLANAVAADPRTDDVVLRIASLEEKLGQPAEDQRLESIATRLDELTEKVQEAPRPQEVSELQSRLADLESSKGDQLEQVGAAIARIEVLESAPAAESEGDARVDALVASLQQLERSVAGLEAAQSPEDIAARVDDIKKMAEEAAPASMVSELGERFDALQASVETLANDVRDAALSSDVEVLRDRLAAVEERSGGDAAAGHDEIESRVSAIEEDLRNLPPDPRWDDMDARVAAIEQADGSGEHEQAVQELTKRVYALETAEPSSDTKEDIEARLDALQQQLRDTPTDSELKTLREHLRSLEKGLASGQGEGGSDLTSLLERLDSLEERTFAIGNGNEGKELLQRIEALEQNGGLTGMGGQMSDLFSRLEAIEQSVTSGSDARVDTLAAKVEALEDGGAGSNVSELVERLEALEQGAQQGEDPRITEVLERLFELEKASGEGASEELLALRGRIEALAAVAQRDPRVDELMEKLSTSGAEVGVHLSDSAVSDRLETLETRLSQVAASGGELPAELLQRIDQLENRLNSVPESDGSSSDTLARLAEMESRWESWSGRTVAKVEALQQRIETLPADPAAAPVHVDAKALTKSLAEILGDGGGWKNDLKAIKSQMPYIYATAGVVYFCICLWVVTTLF